MADSIHITTARAMLNSGDPCDIVLYTKEGQLQRWTDAVSISYDRTTHCRRIRLLRSRQIRQLRDVCIVSVNNLYVYL